MKLLHLSANLSQKQIYVGIISAIGVCLLAGFIIISPDKATGINELAVKVRTITIRSTEDVQEYTYPGEVHGRYEIPLSFQVSGKLIKRQVELGSLVNAGDVLMQIDTKDIQQTVTASSAQRASAESQLQLAENNLNRYRQLLEQSAVSQAQYDQYVNAYNVALANFQQAAAQQTQSANQLDYSLLRADSPGIVANINAETGQVVTAGQTVITIVKDGAREIEIHVPENQIDKLHKISQIKATFWAFPQLKIDGSIREIAPMADPSTRTFKVRISLNKLPPEISLGMTASVYLSSNDFPQTINIPLPAIYQDENTPSVWLVKDNTVFLQPITVGKFGSETVEVLNGLKQGDCIVTAGVHKLYEGEKVRLAGDSL